jgi:DNA-binding NtrC family response regulator
LVEQLCLYDWPFNVRELDLLARRLLVLHGHEALLRRAYLPEALLNRRDAESRAAVASAPGRAADFSGLRPNTPEFHRARRERELALLTQALRTHNGSVARAAAAAGISRQRAYRLMEGGGVVGAAETDDLALDQGDGR